MLKWKDILHKNTMQSGVQIQYLHLPNFTKAEKTTKLGWNIWASCFMYPLPGFFITKVMQIQDFLFDSPVLWVKPGVQSETESLILDQMDWMWPSNYYSAIKINILKAQ